MTDENEQRLPTIRRLRRSREMPCGSATNDIVRGLLLDLTTLDLSVSWPSTCAEVAYRLAPAEVEARHGVPSGQR